MEATGDSCQDKAIESSLYVTLVGLCGRRQGNWGSLKKGVWACSPLPSLGWLSGVMPVIKGHRH